MMMIIAKAGPDNAKKDAKERSGEEFDDGEEPWLLVCVRVRSQLSDDASIR